jgi:hypothetical protein
VYLYLPAVYVARSLDSLEAFIETLVLEYLAANDIGAGLRESERQVDSGRTGGPAGAAVRRRRHRRQPSAPRLKGSARPDRRHRDSAGRGDTDQSAAHVGLGGRKGHHIKDNWAATFLEGRDKVIATSVDAVVHPALRRERGASSPT